VECARNPNVRLFPFHARFNLQINCAGSGGESSESNPQRLSAYSHDPSPRPVLPLPELPSCKLLLISVWGGHHFKRVLRYFYHRNEPAPFDRHWMNERLTAPRNRATAARKVRFTILVSARREGLVLMPWYINQILQGHDTGHVPAPLDPTQPSPTGGEYRISAESRTVG